jgi:hypothetical protein
MSRKWTYETTQNKMVQPDIGRHQAQRKELAINCEKIDGRLFIW